MPTAAGVCVATGVYCDGTGALQAVVELLCVLAGADKLVYIKPEVKKELDKTLRQLQSA